MGALDQVPAAVAGAVVSSAITAVFAWRAGKVRGRADVLEEFAGRIRRLELRTAALRASVRHDRRRSARRRDKGERSE